MTHKREFGLGVILTVTHGTLLCDMKEIYKILNFMTRDSLSTHQLPRVADECTPWIFRQHPQLNEINVSDINRDNVKEKLAALKEKYGESLEIEHIPMDDHDVKDHIEELRELAGDKPMIIINNEDGKLSEDDIRRLAKEKIDVIKKEMEQKRKQDE